MKKLAFAFMILLLAFTAAACGSSETSDTASKGKDASSDKKKIEYLGKTYEVKAPTDKIAITGSVESMEDAKLLDVHPAGAISFSGKFPELFKDITDKSVSTGKKCSRIWKKFLSCSRTSFWHQPNSRKKR